MRNITKYVRRAGFICWVRQSGHHIASTSVGREDGKVDLRKIQSTSHLCTSPWPAWPVLAWKHRSNHRWEKIFAVAMMMIGCELNALFTSLLTLAWKNTVLISLFFIWELVNDPFLIILCFDSFVTIFADWDSYISFGSEQWFVMKADERNNGALILEMMPAGSSTAGLSQITLPLSCDSPLRGKWVSSIICAIKHDQLPVRCYLYVETPSWEAYFQSKHT